MNSLIEVITRRDSETLRDLLERGEEVNVAVTQEVQLDALLLRRSGSEEVHAEPSITTPLLTAVQTGQEECVRLLLDHGAEVDFCPPHTEPGLCVAAAGGFRSIVALLLERGANIEGTGTTGRTALLWAARTNRIAVVQLLLDRGAQGGEQALRWAEELGFAKLAELLRSQGYSVPEHEDTLPPDPFANPRRFYREG